MTPQSSFMVVVPITPSRAAELRKLLDSMNVAPGRVNASNAMIPFAQFEELHFARLLILEDKTTEDVRLHNLPVEMYPLYLAFLADVDGDEEAFIQQLVQRARDGLRMLFACCEGFTSATDLADWLRQHRSPSIANYVNTRGRTVRQVREEATLRDALETYISTDRPSLERLPAQDLHGKLSQFVAAEKTGGHLKLSAEARTPIGWWVRNMMHFIGGILLVIIALPLLIVLTPFYLFFLRRLEKSDPEFCPSVDQAHANALSQTEDHDVTNQFSAMGSLKPGLVRNLTIIGVLSGVNFAARHIVRPGRLGRIRTIHFARWVFIAGRRRMAFFSNYDGSVESYMDDFINKTGFGLNASFSNGIGYPRTNWLVLDGCADERKYKEFLRRHTLLTQVWYKAYPGLTAIDLERNTRIRKGVEAASMSEHEAREWAALL